MLRRARAHCPLDPNEEEVSELKWLGETALLQEMRERPEEYSPWFKAILRDLLVPNWKHLANGQVKYDEHIIKYDNILS